MIQRREAIGDEIDSLDVFSRPTAAMLGVNCVENRRLNIGRKRRRAAHCAGPKTFKNPLQDVLDQVIDHRIALAAVTAHQSSDAALKLASEFLLGMTIPGCN